MKELDPYEEALKRVKRKKNFYRSLFTWVFTSIFLFVVNILTSPGFLWAFFPFVGWGMSIAFQGFEVFGYPGMGNNWEERQLEEEMRRLKKRGLPSAKTEESLDLPEIRKDEDKPYSEEDLV